MSDEGKNLEFVVLRKIANVVIISVELIISVNIEFDIIISIKNFDYFI